MDPNVNSWLQLVFRWIHVVAGVAWIGHLYFFNFVNAQVAKTYDADSKKKVVPELMPRALYWFRWGAMYTWVSGILLAGLIYYMGESMARGTLSKGAATGIGLAIVLFGFFLYDLLWKAMAAKEPAAVAVSLVLVAGLVFGFFSIFKGREAYIHVGMTFGTIMMMNVWMRIWPAQKKIIAAIQAGSAPDGALVSLAGLRSKHNTYLSVPLIFIMLSNHYPLAYGADSGGVILLVLILLGLAVTKLLYMKSASAVTKAY